MVLLQQKIVMTNNSESTIRAEDVDCDDDTVFELDCNDNDSTSTILEEDGDCDGVITAEDCDDSDETSTIVAEDADCDGILTAEDCDDENANRPNNDMDCDGILAHVDCDDNDPTSYNIQIDADCDGTLTPDDCDDSNSESTIIAEDGDCDGLVFELDCDDNDSTSTIVANDADCDSDPTITDCDDTDPILHTLDIDGDNWTSCEGDCGDLDWTVRPYGYERPNDGIDQDCFAGDLKVKASVGNYGGVCILDQRNLGYCWRPGYSSAVLISDQPLVDLQMQSYKTSRYIDQEGTFYHDGTAYPDMTDVIQINEYCA